MPPETDRPPIRLDQATPPAASDAAGLNNMQQLIQLRWFAVAAQAVTIVFVHFGLHIALPIDRMLHAVLFLAVFNFLSRLRWREGRPFTAQELFVSFLVDVGTLTAQLYFSGGATNPFVSLYLLQAILGAVLLSPRYAWTIVALTGGCFALLTQFHLPLPLPQGKGLSDPYTLGVLMCFALNATLLVLFIFRITGNLRARDAHLAALRQRAAEEEHIVRMGLLASGAAHELGTPLSTLAVILGDWQRMEPFRSDASLREEVHEMQTQVARCKAIVTGILLSAGEARGESSAATTVTAFLDDVVAEWRASRGTTPLSFDNRFGDDLPIASDSALRQSIHNVLDNAMEASPRGIGLTATRDDGRLVITVTDSGPGFAPELMDRLGKPYQSTKGRAGGGLGLFLVVNVVRKLGGTVTARHRPGGGAAVTLSLPLASIQLENLEPDGH